MTISRNRDFCYSCEADLRSDYDSPNNEPDNALWVEFSGGYGQFIDPIGDDYEVVICHDCAHALCDALAWVKDLLKPHNSHSHTREYEAAHPDHYGWDYDWQYAKRVIEEFPNHAQQLKDGKTVQLGYLIGQAMKISRGKANPEGVKYFIEHELGRG